MLGVRRGAPRAQDCQEHRDGPAASAAEHDRSVGIIDRVCGWPKGAEQASGHTMLSGNPDTYQQRVGRPGPGAGGRHRGVAPGRKTGSHQFSLP